MTQRNKTGKPFGPPPERGPQPQGMSGGRLVEPKLKKRKRYDINPFLKIKRSEYSKTIKTDKGYTNVPSMYGGQEYNEDFLTEMYKDNKIDPETGRRVKTFKTPEEATVAAKRRSSRLSEGGSSQGERFVKFFGRQFNQNKDFVIKEAMTGLLKKDFQQRFKNIMNQAQKDFYAEEGISPYKMNFVAYNPKKEETGITSKETMGLKKGGFGCPHRENGVKSDIKGISKIQVKGKKFIGVK